jgi:hypothetical protein
MVDALAERSQERDRLIELARRYVDRLSGRVPLVAAAVVGSVARGDFNVWSDVDVVVVAERLPERAPERGRILTEDVPGGVQPVGFTPAEFGAALRRGNPLAAEAVGTGIVLVGHDFFKRAGSDTHA